MAKSKTQDPNHTTLDGEEKLDRYVIAHSDEEPEYLYKLWRATNVRLLHGRMASGHLQGRLLKMFVNMIKPRNIVEVGTFSGYSALCMAEGLEETFSDSEEGHMYTFEVNDEQEDFTRPWIEGSPWAKRVTFIIGDATKAAPEVARSQGIAYDMAFIDGDKRSYISTYEALLPVMSKGGYILADNTLWDGHVVDETYSRDPQTRGILEFNEYVRKDDRVERVILPLRDGLTIIRVKGKQ